MLTDARGGELDPMRAGADWGPGGGDPCGNSVVCVVIESGDWVCGIGIIGESGDRGERGERGMAAELEADGDHMTPSREHKAISRAYRVDGTSQSSPS